MNIAIIGAGNVGRALATAAARNGHTVTIADRDPQEAQSFARSIGIRSVASNAEAVSGADIVIPAVAFEAFHASLQNCDPGWMARSSLMSPITSIQTTWMDHRTPSSF